MVVDQEPGSFRFAGGYATGARLPDIDGLHWIGDENEGYFVDSSGKRVAPEPQHISPPRIAIIDEPPPFFRSVQMND